MRGSEGITGYLQLVLSSKFEESSSQETFIRYSFFEIINSFQLSILAAGETGIINSNKNIQISHLNVRK